jgi:hypothetical protein
LKTEICGFVWFQGWNDMCQPGDAIRQQVYDEYCPNFVHLVQDLRAEFRVPNLPVVMGELGVGGEQADKNMMDFRAAQARIATCPELKGTLGYVRTAPFWYPELDALPRKMESEEHRVRRAVAAQLKEQLRDKPESADPETMEPLVKRAGDEALEKDAAYQKAKSESDSHVCNWYCHYRGSARVYCMVGFSLAEAMKPLLTPQLVKAFILLGQSNMVGLGRIKAGEGSLESAVSGNPGHAAKYEENLVRFIKAVRREFNAPKAPFVLGTMGESVKGSGGNGGEVLEGHLAVGGNPGEYPEFKGNVATIYTHPMAQGGSGNGHYGGNAEVYMDVGEAMGKTMVELPKHKE